ncbi:MAG: hypothetical protein ACYDCO_07710 [Armatimonadota bacterium]
MRILVIASVVLLLSGVGVCLFMLKLHAQAPRTEVTWQSSQSPQVQLGVRDKFGEMGGYTADFVVIGPKKAKYHEYKKVGGDDWGYIIFPRDFEVWGEPGKYTWKCLVNGKPVVEGKFRFTSSGVEVQY